MKHMFPGGQESKFAHLTGHYLELFSDVLTGPLIVSRNYLFFNPVLRLAQMVINRLDTRDTSRMNGFVVKIKENFRINLIKPCKSLKK